MVTPLRDRDELDREGLERLIEHLIHGGVHGLFVLGTTGEAPSLSYQLRRELVSRVVDKVRGRVPVLVGITDTSFVESVSLAKHSAEAGASALVLATPYYFPAGQTELLSYVEHLLQELPLPLMLYNMPTLTKGWFEIETIEKLAHHEKIVGMKDSSGDLRYYERAIELKKIRPDWSMLIGPEVMMARSLYLGGDGGVAGGANVFPELFVSCYKAYRAGDHQRVAELQSSIEAFQKVYDIGKYASRHIKATKCCLSLRGICDDFMAEPFHRFLLPERERVKSILDSLNLSTKIS
jgi:4-hydroxy-tetrahydrodipicolinate synthase